MSSLSRNDLAKHLAQLLQDKALDDDSVAAVSELAKARGFDADLLIDDVKYYLETEHKISSPVVVSARDLTETSKSDITSMIEGLTGTKVADTEYLIDESVVGGAKVSTATTEVDMTVKKMLHSIE